jgi:hypothetical protein
VGVGAGFGFGVGFGLGAGFGFGFGAGVAFGGGVGLETVGADGALADCWAAGTEAGDPVGPLAGCRTTAGPALVVPERGPALGDPTRGPWRPEDDRPPTAPLRGDGTETCRTGGGALAVGRPSSMVVTSGIRSGVRAETQSRVAPASDATATSTTTG